MRPGRLCFLHMGSLTLEGGLGLPRWTQTQALSAVSPPLLLPLKCQSEEPGFGAMYQNRFRSLFRMPAFRLPCGGPTGQGACAGPLLPPPGPSVEPLLRGDKVTCPWVTRRPCQPVDSKVAGLARASEPAFPVRSRKMPQGPRGGPRPPNEEGDSRSRALESWRRWSGKALHLSKPPACSAG